METTMKGSLNAELLQQQFCTMLALSRCYSHTENSPKNFLGLLWLFSSSTSAGNAGRGGVSQSLELSVVLKHGSD